MAKPSIIDHLNAIADDPAKAEDAQTRVREEFLRQEVTIKGRSGETTFTIAKMPATKGWDTLEEIREAAGGQISLGAGGIGGAMQSVVSALPKPFARQLRTTMFGHVTFRNHLAKDPLTLAGEEEMAFDAIEAEPLAIYEIFMRSLALNFTDSFVGLFARISSFLSPISRLPNTETSPPSSPPP